MTFTLKVASMDDLLRMSPQELGDQASIILSGEEGLLDEACDREIIRRLYIPRNLNRPLVYQTPKSDAWLSPSMKQHCLCCECGRPRSYGSGRRCKFCYLLGVRLKFYEASEGAAWLEYQARGIVMPETEWWDDSDIPAQPKRLGPVAWNVDRLDWRRAA